MGTTRAEAIERGRAWSLAQTLGAERAAAVRDAVTVLVATRLLVWAVAAVSVQVGGVATERYDDLALTHPFGGFRDAIFSPLARWDAVWYLRIGAHGYGGPAQGFFPVYPGAVKALALGSSSPGALLVASYLVSLLAFGGALYLLHRLATLELGEERARTVLWLVALFPGAIWYGAPFTESLFLLLSVGALYAARTGRWHWAGQCAALASAARSPGALLIVPLLVMWWQQKPRRAASLAWIALAPVGLIGFSLYLGLAHGDALAWQHWQGKMWFHHFHLLGGVYLGAEAAWDGVRQLISGSDAHIYFTSAGGDPFPVAWHNLQDFVFMLLALVAAAGVVRRLPRAYVAYTLVSLVALLSVPVTAEPLMSIVRYVAVIFPLFMWVALACDRARRRAFVLAAFTLVLVFETVRFATWHWVA